MKAEQSSLYRNIELLHLWCIETFHNVPNQPFVLEDIHLLAENVVQAQSVVGMALNAESDMQRLDLLDVVVMSMTNVKSITKVLTEYTYAAGAGHRCHIISRNQRVAFLNAMTQIGAELGRWRNKTVAQITAAKASE